MTGQWTVTEEAKQLRALVASELDADLGKLLESPDIAWQPLLMLQIIRDLKKIA